MAGSTTESCSPFLESVKENLQFQGFLRKRKDTMRYWARYWFELQNTTLYFYTNHKSQDGASLRGQYYMNRVQSVRNVSSGDGDFTFEIVMKNGKRKLLNADSEDLRDVWIRLLWKAMQLPGPGHHSSSCTWHDIPELLERASASSADGQIAAVTLDNDLKDDVFDDAAGSNDKSSSDAEYDVLGWPSHIEHTVDEDYMTMNQLNLYDTPKSCSTGPEVEGAASPICVLDTAAKVNIA